MQSHFMTDFDKDLGHDGGQMCRYYREVDKYLHFKFCRYGKWYSLLH